MKSYQITLTVSADDHQVRSLSQRFVGIANMTNGVELEEWSLSDVTAGHGVQIIANELRRRREPARVLGKKRG